MNKKLFLLFTILASMFVFNACSNKSNDDQNSSTEEVNSIIETEIQDFDTGETVSDTVGVWSYGQEFIYHASNNTRYYLIEDSNGTIKDTNGKTYTMQENEDKIFYIRKSDNSLTVKEGKYDESYVGTKEAPDGYKPRVIHYKKSDLFNLAILEQAITGEEIQTEKQTQESEIILETESVTTEITAETTTESDSKSETIAETTIQSDSKSETITETTTESDSKSETNTIEENAEYAKIYQDLENFLETDNFIQKDNNNRALEVFNHLHNLSDSNIEQESIINDTDKNEVKFHCYEKYTITINIADSIITVTED